MMKNLIILFLILTTLAGCKIKGISYDSLPSNGNEVWGIMMNDLNCTAIEFQMKWKEFEPVIGNGISFREFDKKLVQYEGLEYYADIGGVDVSDLPMYNGARLDPDADFEFFLNENYDFIYCTVNYYKGRGIKNWLIGSEMNEAKLRIRFGWLRGYVFEDYNNLDRLIERQYRAVKDADPTAQVGIIYHTGIHSAIHHHTAPPGYLSGSMIAGIYDWREMMNRWNNYQDIIALDNYPNYYTSDPVYSEDLYWQVIEAKLKGKPVFVTETQYPYSRITLPAPVQFTEAKQAQYLTDLYNSVGDIVDGFFVFNLYANGVVNNYTERDLEALRILGTAFHDGDAPVLIKYYEQNQDYCLNTLPTVLQYAERGLGILGTDGYKTQGYYAVKNMFYEPPPE